MSGWIKLHRGIQNHWIFSEKPFSKFQAWIDLILLANHKENKILLGNELITVERGSFITSDLKLMNRWGWSKTKVRNFLKLLESEGMIIRKADSKKTIITIVNYNVYQEIETTEKLEKDREKTNKKLQKDMEKTWKGLQKDTNKNDKNVKNDKKYINTSCCDEEKERESKKQEQELRYGVDDINYKVALYLREKILQVNPNCKVPNEKPKDMQKWANDIRLTFEMDKRTKEEMKEIIHFAFTDSFWQTIIRSPSGLRKNWDSMYGQMLRKKNTPKQTYTPRQSKFVNFQQNNYDFAKLEQLERQQQERMLQEDVV